ncbi:MAG: DUF4430 domain-containing protein [Bacillota bacterium]|nr:DUF4430 domain-containing protein [Bacillota bacterium]
MLKRNAKLILMFMFVFGLFLNGFQAQTLAAGETANVTVEGSQDTGTLLPAKSLTLSSKETAFDALVNAVGESNVDYSNESYGKMIKGIYGLKSQGTFYWGFYVNGIAAQVGADQYKVLNGEQITFRYIDWTKTPENTVSLKVIGNNQNAMNNLTNVEFIGNSTAFQLLQVAVGPDKVLYSDSKYGKYITSINGLAAQGNSYWAFYVNGKMSDVGADSYQLKPSDQISFQYETYTPSGNPGGSTNQTNSSFSSEKLQKSISSGIQYVNKNQIGEWEAMALNKARQTIPASYLENVKSLVKEKSGHFSKITDVERYVLGILAAGGDPENIEGYNLVQSIYNGNVTKQGLNGVAYALIALDSGNFTIPNTAQWTREKLVNYLMEYQNKDGGWTWDGSSTSNPDTTAMILTALAPYKDQQGVKDKVNLGVQYLSTQYQSAKIDNSSTAAQIVIALSSLDVDSNGTLFTKDNNSLINYLLSFQNTTANDKGFGGFKWKQDNPVDSFSTAQGIQAIVAYQLFQNKKGTLYHFTYHELPTSVVEETSVVTPKGNPLPNTATNAANLLLIGSILLFVGLAILIRQRLKSY